MRSRKKEESYEKQFWRLPNIEATAIIRDGGYLTERDSHGHDIRNREDGAEVRSHFTTYARSVAIQILIFVSTLNLTENCEKIKVVKNWKCTQV